MDEARRNTLGIEPLKAELLRIDSLKDKRGKESTRYLLDLSRTPTL